MPSLMRLVKNRHAVIHLAAENADKGALDHTVDVPSNHQVIGVSSDR